MAKILIIADYFQPYIGYSKVHIARELIKKGNRVKIVTSNRFFPFPEYQETVGKRLGSRIRKVGFEIEEGIPVLRKKTLFECFARAYFRGIGREISTFEPDIVIVYAISSFSSIQVSNLKKKFNFKLILVDTHLPSELERGNQFLKRLFYYVFRLLFAKMISRNANKIIAAQEDTKKIIKDVYGIIKKAVLVDQGTDENIFRYSEKYRRILRKKYSLIDSDFIVIYTGKVIPAKGVDLLFQAFAILSKKYRDIFLCVVGGGEDSYIRKCKSFLSKEEQKRVIWVEFQPESELPKYYSMSDVGVWPLQDALSMNDIAACSRPFIANDTLGGKTRIENNNALLYKRGDFYDLSKKIEYLYKNPKTRLAMGRRGRELVERKLSWVKIADEYINLK